MAVALTADLLGPGAYSVATAATTHSGAIPSAGPTGAGGSGMGGPGGLGGGTRGGFAMANAGNRTGGGTQGGGPGGILGSSTPSAELVEVLDADAGQYRWVAATVSSNQAAGYQLATDAPVMAIGGFNGTDPSPTLAEFQALVKAGDIHWFIASSGGGMGGGPGGSSTTSTNASQITAWVTTNFTAKTVGGVTLYDLSS